MRKDRRGVGVSGLLSDRRGATAVEYGLILALVFLAVMGGIASLGGAVQNRWDDIAGRVTSV